MIWIGLIVLSALGFVMTALDAILTGIKFKNDGLLIAVGKDTQAIGACMGVGLLMLVFIGMNAGLFFRPNKCLSVLYGILLFFTFITFFAFGAGLFYYSAKTRPMLDKECANKSSPIH